MDFENLYMNDRGEIGSPIKKISKEEAIKIWPKHDQPERSKREDDKKFNEFVCGNCQGYKLSSNFCRCGALNSMET